MRYKTRNICISRTPNTSNPIATYRASRQSYMLTCTFLGKRDKFEARVPFKIADCKPTILHILLYFLQPVRDFIVELNFYI